MRTFKSKLYSVIALAVVFVSGMVALAPNASAVAVAYRDRTNDVTKVLKVKNGKLGWYVDSNVWSNPIQVKYWKGIRQIKIGSKTRTIGNNVQITTSTFRYEGY